ncbi:hypothetical protein D3C76_1527780 [compost metagenome]
MLIHKISYIAVLMNNFLHTRGQHRFARRQIFIILDWIAAPDHLCQLEWHDTDIELSNVGGKHFIIFVRKTSHIGMNNIFLIQGIVPNQNDTITFIRNSGNQRIIHP